MKIHVVSYVGWLLLAAALGFYVYGMYSAIELSWPKTPSDKPLVFHDVLSTTIGSMQALLLTNLGMLLGISVANPNSGVARALKLDKKGSYIDQAPPPPMEMKEKIQLFALVIYVFSLIACFATWTINGFSSESTQVVSLIPESGKLFIGVALAYLTAILK